MLMLIIAGQSTGLSQVWWLSPWSDAESLQNHSKHHTSREGNTQLFILKTTPWGCIFCFFVTLTKK